MLFDTPVYFVFLTLVVTLYWRLGWRSQNRLLLAASYFFYGWWDWRFLLLMALSTVVDYALAKALAAAYSPRRRYTLLAISLAMNFGFLGFFKYCNFFLDSFEGMLTSLGIHGISRPLLQVLLPPGISFYTFQGVAYIVDVYRGKLAPAKSLVDYALFISLFPHLIAGPIQRPSHLLPQVERTREFVARDFFDGLLLIATGLFRKCVIADHCALLANAGFNGHLGNNLFSLVIASWAFMWQIYGDFSGYSDIARGSAKLLGFHFMVNFRQPYFATSLQDFWRRWHISLSSWLRDYLYIPLGGNRKGTLHTYVNLMITMLLGGLWHGANWTFVLWGGLHGIGLSLERAFTRAGLGRIATILTVVLAWVFFRATSVGHAIAMLRGAGHLEWRPEYAAILIFLGVASIATLMVDARLEHTGEEYPFQHRPAVVPALAGLLLLASVAVLGAVDSHAFIYFQF
jgi:D-alanyl-lipoteichoic acid acyltransferase DltB (MBOAT superfamily)